MIEQKRFDRLKYRAWHRGTKEADLLIGGFLDTHGARWSGAQADWFEALLDEDDVEIMAWAIGTAQPPPRYEGEMMQAMRKLDYIPIQK